MRITVLGAGSWGTTVASILTRRDHESMIWARSPGVAEEINEQHTNSRYLPGFPLPARLRATADLEQAARSLRGGYGLADEWVEPGFRPVVAAHGFAGGIGPAAERHEFDQLRFVGSQLVDQGPRDRGAGSETQDVAVELDGDAQRLDLGEKVFGGHRFTSSGHGVAPEISGVAGAPFSPSPGARPETPETTPAVAGDFGSSRPETVRSVFRVAISRKSLSPLTCFGCFGSRGER